VTTDQVFCFAHPTIHRLQAEGWQALDGPQESGYRDLWGHPDQGLYLTDSLDQIHHRDLPDGRHVR